MDEIFGFPRSHRVKARAINWLFRAVPPFVLGRTRTQALRLIGISIGRGTAFWGCPTIVGDVQCERRLNIGAHCGFNVGCFFGLEGSITIGNHVDVGHHVMFLSQATRLAESNQSSDSSIHGSIVVGDGAWLGARCTVLPGVTVGAGSVVAAGAVVSKNLPENTLFTGSRNISLARWR